VAALEGRIFERVNAARRRAGVPPLKLVERLSEHARHHSRRMRDAGFVGHQDPQLGDMVERADAAGFGFLRLAENVGYVKNVDDPADALHGHLMSSPGHRANLLDRYLTHVGIGVAVRGSEVWLTEVFVKPRAGGLR
jgi:uncharacterized protein YkwD